MRQLRSAPQEPGQPDGTASKISVPGHSVPIVNPSSKTAATIGIKVVNIQQSR
jgi:hypothetical protein